ncbi:carboxymuconolactone decarboxylase family protein [Photobacterium kishitanii]|uniref:carboxymuconolactone decarboxylase family protein n=1 Tax=Photobacterium kishitanii TaxID=318456 RepID=UPI001EFE030A|nr:carboxymuconolactone decarboxylase family protein [Photobacterium kishitanii]
MTSKEKDLMAPFARVPPQFYQLTSKVQLEQVWRDESLSLRDRSLITVTALVGLNRMEQLPRYLERALDNGLNKE